MKSNYKYISSTLPYINSKPHVGHAFEFILTDIIARFYRSEGYEVLFNTGVDEHGIKVQKAAIAEGLTPQEYCNSYAFLWKEFCLKFQISCDNFYRTTSSLHKTLVLKIFKDFLLGRLFTDQKIYAGNYCEGCESFLTDRDIEDGKCKIHKTEVKLFQEENWFFDLKYFREQGIKDVLVNKDLSLELYNTTEFYDEISITRENVEWGIKLSDKSTIYVWSEALLNYCLSAGFLTDTSGKFEKYWESALIVCGKDNLKFQAYILQALSLALNIGQTKEVLVHGTILAEDGTKMSKTIGNVIDPIEQLEQYGISPLRYYLFFGLNTFEDSTYSENRLIELWNSEVVNGFGNLLARVLHLIDIKNIEIKEELQSRESKIETLKRIETLKETFLKYNFTNLRFQLNVIVSELNQKINTDRPFDKSCLNVEECLNDLYFCILVIAKYYKIILPEFADKIEECLNLKKKAILFNKLEQDALHIG